MLRVVVPETETDDAVVNWSNERVNEWIRENVSPY
jgi:hypothetical protein